ncbi:MAG: DUF374 domain-containing protein [Acidobacteria bacterium]|nr:MAG: DUF374 domain-containing protein [Acidobacteriota bacterium]
MKVDPHRWPGRLLLRFGGWILRCLLRVLGTTCRLRVVAGEEHLEPLLAPAGPPFVLSLWHDRAVLAALYFHRWVRRGLDLTMLASHSRDGELVSYVARGWRLRLVRGSASRGGSQALRGVYRMMTRERSSPVMIPDGPRGPRHRFKVGVAVLAQMAGRPILPFGFAAARARRLRSWDRLIVPRPFTAVVAVVGPPQTIPRGLDAAGLEAERRRLENLLCELTRRAEAAVAG